MSSVQQPTSGSSERNAPLWGTVLPAHLRRCARRAGLIFGLFLSLFHLRLLWGRMAEGALLRPEIGIRWLAALGLALGLVLLQRRGFSVIRGRRASAVWLLVFLLHVGVPEASTGLSASAAGPVELLLLLPTAAVVVVARRLCPRHHAGRRVLSSIRSTLFYLGRVDGFPRPALRSCTRTLTLARPPPRGLSFFFA